MPENHERQGWLWSAFCGASGLFVAVSLRSILVGNICAASVSKYALVLIESREMTRLFPDLVMLALACLALTWFSLLALIVKTVSNAFMIVAGIIGVSAVAFGVAARLLGVDF